MNQSEEMSRFLEFFDGVSKADRKAILTDEGAQYFSQIRAGFCWEHGIEAILFYQRRRKDVKDQVLADVKKGTAGVYKMKSTIYLVIFSRGYPAPQSDPEALRTINNW